MRNRFLAQTRDHIMEDAALIGHFGRQPDSNPISLNQTQPQPDPAVSP
jgi:hypothetical protein